MLTADRLRELLNYNSETGLFTWKVSRGRRHLSGMKAGNKSSEGYINLVVEFRQYKAHRLAWLYVYGEWPSEQIDHANLDRADNRICNLRLSTHSQNQINSRAPRNNTSGVKGVRFYSPNGKWLARIGVNGKRVHLGYFDSKEEATQAYAFAAEKYHGEFARVQ